MASKSRVGDIFAGVCCCHPPIPCIGMAGIIVTGCGCNNTDDRVSAIVGSLGVGFCGHPTVIVAGSGVTNCEGSSEARVGDPVVGCIIGAMVTGSGVRDDE
jgi:hypothetical protein